MRKPKPIQINIPDPCHQDWNKVMPADQGRFCDSCKKCVVDFTNFTDKDIYKYISKNKDGEICGRFRSSQLNRQLNITAQPNSSLYRYFIGVGLTLLFTQVPKASFAQPPQIHNTDVYATPQTTKSSLRIMVMDSMHHAVTRARVQVLLKDSVIKDSFCDNQGGYEIDLAPGRYEVRLFHPGFRPGYTTGIIISPEKITHFYAKLEYSTPAQRDPVIAPYKVPLIGNEIGRVALISEREEYTSKESEWLNLGGIQSTEGMKSDFIIDGVPLAQYQHSTPFQRRWWKLKSSIRKIFH